MNGYTLRDRIIAIFNQNKCQYTHLIHDETPTSEDSAKVRGTSMQQGVKSIILRGKKTGKNYQFNLSSHQKLNMNTVRELVGEKCEFESQKNLLDKFGLQPGGIPPFGNFLGIPNYVEEGIIQSEISAFNCGLRTESIIIKSSDLLSFIEPIIGKFAE